MNTKVNITATCPSPAQVVGIMVFHHRIFPRYDLLFVGLLEKISYIYILLKYICIHIN